MIEVLKIDNDQFLWTLISEIGNLQVIGDIYPTDIIAHQFGKDYRTNFRLISACIDCYKDYF